MKKILYLAGAAMLTSLLLSTTFKTKEPAPLPPECYISWFTTETRQLIELDAAKPGFGKLHPNPIILQNYTALVETIDYKTADGKMASGLFIKAKQPTDKWLLVFQE
jgi:carboxymethylenebutenolidase